MAFASCSKKVTELPAPTDTGANTFGASINGTLWAPQGYGIMSTAPILEASFAGNNSYIIHARNFSKEPKETEFEIYLKNITAPGRYTINANTNIEANDRSGSYIYYVEREVNPLHEYITSSTTPGTVTITKLDIPNHILSGTFSFTGKAIMGGGDPIAVTDGRFDVKIQ